MSVGSNVIGRYGVALLLLLAGIALITAGLLAPVGRTQAVYPSRLHQCGRSICDSSGAVMPPMKGFNVEVFNRQQSDWDAMKGLGSNFARLVIQWNTLEPSKGQFSSTYASEIDQTIAQAQSDGFYVELELHINGGHNWPTWTNTGGQGHMSQFVTDGQGVVQYLAKRYANNPVVMGFGLNEPPVDNVNTSSVWPHLEGQERTVINWFRAYAPQWIGFVAGPYASATPIFNLPCARAGVAQNSYTNASTTAYDSVGGNVVLDMHDYQQGTTTSRTGFDGRAANGENNSYTQGGQVVKVGDVTPSQYPSPHNGTTSRTILESQMKAWVCPYATYAAAYDGRKGIPLMAGEFGWTVGSSTTTLQRGKGDTAYAADLMQALDTAGPVIRSQWDFSHAQANGQDPWAAMPQINSVNTWQPFTTSWESSP